MQIADPYNVRSSPYAVPLIAAIFVLLFTIVGCSSNETPEPEEDDMSFPAEQFRLSEPQPSWNLTPQQDVYFWQGRLLNVMEKIEEYAALPACEPELGIVTNCHYLRVIGALVQEIERADQALDSAETMVHPRANHSDAATLIAEARNAMDKIMQSIRHAEVEDGE